MLKGIKGISWLADACMYLFFALLLYVFFFGGFTVYIIDTGFSALGNMFQNFIALSTWTDALRTSNFPQNWTIFFWAYWMVWCVASPFFMGSISYKEFNSSQEAGNMMKLFWSVMLIMMPIALIFSEESMQGLQTVSIIAAFPIAFVIIIIIASFIKEARTLIRERKFITRQH